MFEKNKKDNKNFEIVIAKFYSGGIEPKSPSEGTVWYNDYEHTVSVYIGNKWFKCVIYGTTEYTEEQTKEMKKLEEQKEKEEKTEIEKYRKFINLFKELLNESEEENESY